MSRQTATSKERYKELLGLAPGHTRGGHGTVTMVNIGKTCFRHDRRWIIGANDSKGFFKGTTHLWSFQRRSEFHSQGEAAGGALERLLQGRLRAISKGVVLTGNSEEAKGPARAQEKLRERAKTTDME